MNRDLEGSEVGKSHWSLFRDAATAENKSACPEANDLAAYLEGVASRRQRDAIEEHLAKCASCVDALVETRSLLGGEISAAPAGVVARAKALVARTVPGERAWAPRLPFWWDEALGWSAAAVVVMGACVLGLMLGESECTGRQRIEDSTLVSVDLGVSRAMGAQMGGPESQFIQGGGL